MGTPFVLGQRVKLSDRGKGLYMHGTSRRGVVVGFGRTHGAVRVKWDHTKTVVGYHPEYLLPDWSGGQ